MKQFHTSRQNLKSVIAGEIISPQCFSRMVEIREGELDLSKWLLRERRIDA